MLRPAPPSKHLHLRRVTEKPAFNCTRMLIFFNLLITIYLDLKEAT